MRGRSGRHAATIRRHIVRPALRRHGDHTSDGIGARFRLRGERERWRPRHRVAYAIGQNGALTPLSVPTVATGGNNSQLIAVDPKSRYAYVSNVSSDTVAQFSIDPATGALAPLSPATVSMGSDTGVYYPWSIAVHPSGKWAYVSLGQRGRVNEYAIGSDGTLSPMNPPSVPAGGYPDTIALDPSGKHAYVSDGRENDVYQYTIDQASGRSRR